MKKVLGALATVLAAPFLVSFPLYRREIVRARARIVAGSVLAQTACGPIEYASAGEGPVLVAVHGAGGGWDQGIDLAGELAASGFRVVAPSRFGYLRTPLPRDASAEAQADAHASLLDALGVRRAAILGASAGAPSALQFAIRHPDRCAALVLMVPAAFTPRPGNAPSVRTPSGVPAVFGTALRWDYLFWLFERLLRPLAVRTIMGTPTGVVARAGRSERDRVDMMLRHVLPVSARRLGLVNDAAVVSTLRRYDLESISAPTLVFAAPDCGYGTWKPASYTAAHIRGARFVGFPSGGHLLVGHETEILAGIANFLREVTKDPGS